jgi:hypothetical protein
MGFELIIDPLIINEKKVNITDHNDYVILPWCGSCIGCNWLSDGYDEFKNYHSFYGNNYKLSSENLIGYGKYIIQIILTDYVANNLEYNFDEIKEIIKNIKDIKKIYNIAKIKKNIIKDIKNTKNLDDLENLIDNLANDLNNKKKIMLNNNYLLIANNEIFALMDEYYIQKYLEFALLIMYAGSKGHSANWSF